MAARWPSCRLTKSIGSRIGVSRVRSCALGCRQGREPRPTYPPHRVPGPHARPCRRCDRGEGPAQLDVLVVSSRARPLRSLAGCAHGSRPGARLPAAARHMAVQRVAHLHAAASGRSRARSARTVRKPMAAFGLAHPHIRRSFSWIRPSRRRRRTGGLLAAERHPQTGDIAMEHVVRDGLSVRVRLHEALRRLARAVVGHVPRNDVRVQVRHGVPEHLEIELRGTVVRLERPRDLQDFPEVGRRVWITQLGEVGDVSAAPDHDRVARLTDVAPNEIGIGDAAREDARVAVCLVGSAFRAHRTALARLAFVPVFVPSAAHRRQNPSVSRAVLPDRPGEGLARRYRATKGRGRAASKSPARWSRRGPATHRSGPYRRRRAATRRARARDRDDRPARSRPRRSATASLLRRSRVQRDRDRDGPQRSGREDARPPRAHRSPRAIGGHDMTDEERLARELREVALRIHTPASVSSAVDRAVVRATTSPSSWVWTARPRAALAAVGVIAVVVLVVSLVVAGAPASASDLLVRAERAAAGATSAFDSYRGTVAGQNWMGGDGKRLAVPASYEQKIEFRAPSSLRIETTATDPSGATGRQVLFFDGKAAWIYVPDAKVAQPIDPRMVLSQGPFAPSTLAGAIEALSQVFTAKQLGDDTIIGRTTHVLELTPKQPSQTGTIARITTWLDTATLLQLGADVRDAQGQLLMTWRFVGLELNADVPASDFSFTPGGDVRIGQVLPPPGATTGMRLELWSQLAAQSSFSVFRPFCGIDGLDEGMPARDDRGVVILPFTANGAPVVVMQQGPRDAFPSASGESVTVGDVSAIYRTADGTEHLDLDPAGTHVHIQAPQPLGRDPLYHLAVSLVPVAKP